MEKGIELYHEDGYYGNTINIWTVNGKGMDRTKFLKDFMYCLKEYRWFVENIDMREALDFYDTLSNGLNADDLYNNMIQNVYWLDKFENKVYDLGLYDKYKIIVHNKENKVYGNHETISLFGYFTPYLKSNENFIDWFFNKLDIIDKSLFYSITDDSKSKEALLNYKRQLLEQEKKSLDYYEKELKSRQEKCDKILSEIQEIERGLQ